MQGTLAGSPSRVRNICVLAHVDHGKTSLTDSLLAASGYIHQRDAGELRFMDFREDEQRRGITMKSSAVVLMHKHGGDDAEKQQTYVVNLVDSPGHVDFTGEVEAAMSVCDGAILVVDVAEGVCAQTVTVLRLALQRGIQPVLVLNKIDRLFTELKLEPLDAYQRISQVVEQVNVIVGVRDLDNIIKASESFAASHDDESAAAGDEQSSTGWSVDEADKKTTQTFSPENGNVAFASAVDGWAFRVDDFASIYAKKFGLRRDTLVRTLWGDYYINTKTKRIVHDQGRKGGSNAKPMFVGFILENIWRIYEAVQHCDPLSLEKRKMIVEKLGLKVATRDHQHREGKIAVKAIMNSWLPASKGLLDMVVEKLPSPDVAQRNRLHLIWPHPKPPNDMLATWERIRDSLQKCDPSDDAPLIAFVSKMIAKPEERSNNQIRQPKPRRVKPPQNEENASLEEKLSEVQIEEEPPAPTDPLVAFTRVLSGSIKANAEVYVYGPRFRPGQTQGFSRATVTEVALLMGRNVTKVDKISAGFICGLEGLDDAILKTGTVSTCPPDKLFPLASRLGGTDDESSDLVVRVALEPHTPQETEKLQIGLRKLNQADPMVDTYVMETGEMVLAVTGELHLERCLVDLRERFAKDVRFHVSPPIVSFRETVVATGEPISVQTANKLVTIEIRCRPMPVNVARKMDALASRVRSQLNEARKNNIDVEQLEGVKKSQEELLECFQDEPEFLKEVQERLWSSGPRGFGSNLILGPKGRRPTVSKSICSARSMFLELETEQETNELPALVANSIVAGFQHCTAAGPLCEEPVYGVCFEVVDVRMQNENEEDSSDAHGPLSGQLISSVKEVCRQALLNSKPRLVEALLRVEIQTTADTLGSMYTVISKRRGRIIREEIKEGASIFEVEALIPITESFGFAEVLRRQTSGQASPQMVRSHWEMLDQDPLWVPQTEEELEDWSLEDKTVANNNLAAKLMNRTRERKGLLEGKIVEKAEKQRTLKRNK